MLIVSDSVRQPATPRRGANEESALSRLFSAGVLRELARKGRSPLFARLFTQARLANKQLERETVGGAFDLAFAFLRKSGIRNEYVYRAALAHNVLLGRHNLRTASMLAEFRVGSCKADVVVLNGTSTVYEIKSDRDSLTRLGKQISNYRKVFARVYVIAADAHVSQIVRDLPDDIGVMKLVRWNRIHTIREAVDRSDAVCPLTIFDSLRSSEAQEILRALQIKIPDLPNTVVRSAMRERFRHLKPAEVHDWMVPILKRTRSLATLHALISRLPASLQPAALSIRMRRGDHNRFVEAVQTPLATAMSWA